MNISIIGAGYVGLVTGASLAELGHTVTVMDIDEERIARLDRGIIPIHEPGLNRFIEKNTGDGRLSFTTSTEQAVRDADVHFICVWTPPQEDGTADLSAVRAAARALGREFSAQNKKDQIIVTKSTVPVGTGKMIQKIIREEFKGDYAVVSNPEFLREGQAVADMMHPDRIVVGSNNQGAAEVVLSLYEKIKAPALVVDLETAEMIKYAANAFLATKISFINEVANVCERVGADVDMVAEGIGMDPRIGKHFLKAGIGYGGSCFPKDVRALRQFANHEGYDFKLLKSVIEVNEQQRATVVEKLLRHLDDVRDKDILVLGLAFKAHTDDVRESAAIDIIRRLQKLGARVRAYDPLALINAQRVLDENVTYVRHPHDGSEGADAIVIATEWPEFRDLDWKLIKSKTRTPVLVDGRNLLNAQEMKKHGFKYEGVGRK